MLRNKPPHIVWCKTMTILFSSQIMWVGNSGRGQRNVLWWLRHLRAAILWKYSLVLGLAWLIQSTNLASPCSMAFSQHHFPEGWGIRDSHGWTFFGPPVAVLKGCVESTGCMRLENPVSSIFTSCQTRHYNLSCKVFFHMLPWGHFPVFIHPNLVDTSNPSSRRPSPWFITFLSFHSLPGKSIVIPCLLTSM